MVDAIAIAAQPRDRAGKGAARATRRAGMVPAVIYGGKQAPEMIQIERLLLNRHLKDPKFLTHVFDVTVRRQDAEGAWPGTCPVSPGD